MNQDNIVCYTLTSNITNGYEYDMIYDYDMLRDKCKLMQ